jgi:hypothetical protein
MKGLIKFPDGVTMTTCKTDAAGLARGMVAWAVRNVPAKVGGATPEPLAPTTPLALKDMDVLRVLSQYTVDQKPIAVPILDLATRADMDRRIAGECSQRLIGAGYAQRLTDRGGVAITPAGQEAMAEFDRKCPAH